MKLWCLGNEMDGPWQLGHRDADDYGKIASRTAKALKQLDPSVQLVICGSSGSKMPTFGSWERTVLEHAYDDVEFISCHAYYEPVDGDIDSFLASSVDMDGFIRSVVDTADHVKAVLRSEKTIDISFDEWNVWYQSDYHAAGTPGIDEWPYAPRLLEDQYSVADGVVVGSLLITLLQHADRVKAASLAQLVNVIAPIMTEPGGPAWRQTIFFPFAITSRLARGRALKLGIETSTVDTAKFGAVPVVDAVATIDDETGDVAVFLVNRDRTAASSVSVSLVGLEGLEVREALTLADDDLDAANTLADPNRVAPTDTASVSLDGTVLTVELPPVSWTAIALGRSGETPS